MKASRSFGLFVLLFAMMAVTVFFASRYADATRTCNLAEESHRLIHPWASCVRAEFFTPEDN